MPVSTDQDRRSADSTTLVTLPPNTEPTADGVVDTLIAADGSLDVLVVSYDASPEDWIRTLYPTLKDRIGEYGVVSVNDTYRSAKAHPGTRTGHPRDHADSAPPRVTPIDDSADIAAIGIACTEYLNQWHGTGRKTVLLFDCISEARRSLEPTQALQFFHIIRHATASVGGSGFFFVRPHHVGRQTVSALETTFDTVTEVVDTDTGGPAVGDDDPLMSLLANPIRRGILAVLTVEGTVTVSTLLDQLRATELPQDRPRLAAALFHTHLPKLAAAGIIAFDAESETVDLAVPVDRFRPYIRLAQEGHASSGLR